jgi:hypothetical protein
MTPQKKENIQYITAIGFLISGIVMCFLSFFLNEYDIANGPLFYLGTATTFCGAVFGINLMVQNQVMHAEARINHRVDQRIEEEERKRDHQHKEDIEPDYIDPPDMNVL